MKKAPGDEWQADPLNPDERLFDSFARNAGASLRSPAPDDGASAAIRQGSRQRTRRLALEVAVVVALVAAGVAVFSRSDRVERNVDVPPQPTTATTVASVPTSIPSAAEIRQWFLAYTGNPQGVAAGEPVKFGVVMPVFGYQYQLKTAVNYLNDEAGGVGGRPIELDVCKDELAACADRFAADPAVVAVLEDTWEGSKLESVFHDSVSAALDGRKPLLTTDSNAGTSGVGYYPTYTEALWAMALQAKKLTAPGDRVLVIAGNLDADLQPDSPPLTSGLDGREVVVVRPSDTESLADAIRNAGATDAAAVVLAAPDFSISQVQMANGGLLCDAVTEAFEELNMHAAVVVDACEPHEGWYKVAVGFNESSPGPQSGALQIITAMPHLGDSPAGPATHDVRQAGALLAVVRAINQLGGPSRATPAQLDRAMREFTDPVPLGAGPTDCTASGHLVERRLPGSCVRFVDVHQFVHNAWIDLAPIDLAA